MRKPSHSTTRSGDLAGDLSRSPTTLRIGPWEVDIQSHEVLRSDGTVRLEPRVMAVLLCLVKKYGQVVGRAELLETVWPDCTVGDDALNQTVSKLRRALRDKPEGQKIIETVPKVGYRLVAPVTPTYASRPVGDPIELSRCVVQPENLAGGTAGIDPSVHHDVSAPEGSIHQKKTRWAALTRVVAFGLALVAFFIVRRLASIKEPPPTYRLTPLTTFKGLEVEPAASPDGTRVAFSWTQAPAGPWHLYVANLNAGMPFQLTSGPVCDHHPVWSPDGVNIAFARFHRDGRPCEIRLIPSLGGVESVLTQCEEPVIFDLTWSADGRRLVYPTRSEGEAATRLVEFDLETNTKRFLTSPPPDSRGDLAAVFAPVGSKLALVRSLGLGVDDIWLLNPGEPLRQLTFDGASISGLDWMPDGHNIVFSSQRGGGRGLWKVSDAGGAPEPFPLAMGESAGLSVLRNGSVAVEIWEREANVYRIDLRNPNADPVAVITSTQWDRHPDLRPDGRRIAFVSNRSGAPEIWVSDPGGARATQRTHFAGSIVGWPQWSPDGSTIAFETHQGGQGDIWLLGGEQYQPQRLTSHPAEDVGPVWSADGQYIFFVSNRHDRWQIWKKPAAGGEAQQITRGGGSAVQISPDGTVLYFNRPRSGQIWQIPAEGGEETILFSGVQGTFRPTYAATNEAVYFVRTAEGVGPVLTRFDLESRKIETVRALEKLAALSGFDISPDGLFLYYSRVDQIDIDIALLETLP